MIHHIVISYDNNKYLPMFTSIGAHFKEENIFRGESNILVLTNDYFVIHEKIEHAGQKIDIIVTYEKNELKRGFLYVNNKEFSVVQHASYVSLQIGKWCYDNISVFRLLENPFV